MTPDDLAGRLDALEAKLDRLTALVEGLAAGPTAADGDDVDLDEPWRRLGLTEGERRIVTVLFADVSGFTALSEQLDPEAVSLVLRDTMALLAACVAEEGGTVEKFIGDAVCAIFGAPVAYADEPERAARTALAMHRAMAERAETRPDLPVLTVHVGINTGPVIAGAVGDGSQFGVMGDTINTAARLMDLAGDGETFVSAATARRLRRSFVVEDRGVREAKGKAKPVAVAALVAVRPPDDAGPDAGVLRAPLVGRESELSRLRALAARAATGDGATVALVGGDGAGTTRLASALAAELEATGWRALSGSARVQAETPLGLVADALGPLLAGPAGEVAGGAAGPLAETLVAGDVAAPHDFELVLGQVVEAAAAEQPLVVVLDDADGADPGSIEVLRYLSRATASSPVLWVLTGNEVPPPFDPHVAGDDVEVVEVAPLTDADLAELYEALLPGALTAPQRDRLAHLADGNPQFAEEIAQALVDDGVVVEGDGGRWVAVGDVDACELPGSVAELVEARIDQLSTAARLTLQDASVIGLRFSRRLLERVATVTTGLDAALAELVGADLVEPAGPEGGLWAFRSRLVREVAYESILRRRRPHAHRAVADALVDLEAGHVEENADLLAHHLEHGDDPPLAVPHLLVAVDRAERACNLTGALDRARRGLRLRDRFPGRVPDTAAVVLLKRAGIAKLLLGDASGLDELEAAADLLEASGATPAAQADLADRVGWYLTVDRQPDAAAEHLRRAESLAATLPDGPARRTVLAGVAASRAFAAGALGDVAGGLARIDVAVADAAGDPFAEARTRLVAGVLRLWDGDPAGAADVLDAAVEHARANRFATVADRAARWLVTAMVEADRLDEAEAVSVPILARVDDRGDPTVACGIRASLALGRHRAGRRTAAATAAREAATLAAEHRVAPEAAADTHLALALLALDAAAEADGEHRAHHLYTAGAELAAAEVAHAGDRWLAWRTAARVAPVRAAVDALRGGAPADRVTVPR